VAPTAIARSVAHTVLVYEQVGDALDVGRYAPALGVHLAGSARDPDRPGRAAAPEREDPALRDGRGCLSRSGQGSHRAAAVMDNDPGRLPRMCTVRALISITNRTYRRCRKTVSTCRKSHARIPEAWAARNCRQVGDVWRGAGLRSAAARIRRIVPSPTRWPRPASSPWMRR
jgi:hypothetical protein